MNTEFDWDAIEGFLGYGRFDAPVVFIGMEEGLGDADLAADLAKRSRYETVRPLNPELATIQPTWGTMSELMLRRGGVQSPSRNQKLAYQNDMLGSSNDETLLTELLPLPKRRRQDWPAVYASKYPTQDQYLREVLPKRQALLATLFERGKRELIVIYGKEHAPRYHGTFGTRWNNHAPFLTTERFGARVVLSPHFVSPSFAKDRQRFFQLCLG